ncbi:MAG: four-carbon acid sugar kinase family protein [Acidobacteriota bacterium]|nr:four-carbon acid sugar kinase family protein [Acidobacteriota bacterium]
MAELLVIADDLTGALDAGVQLARKGDRVLVSLDCEGGLEHASQADVVVIDAESRHDAPEVAHGKVGRLVAEGRRLGVPHVYKKTDSGLRGNVGAELSAVLDASGASHLNFVPAYPKQQRITEGGVHYVAGVPLAKSIFSVDPVNPVTCSAVSDLVHLQSDVPVMGWEAGADLAGVVVYDCATDDDMRRIADLLRRTDPDAPMAGCAGLLEMLPPYSAGAGRATGGPALSERLVVVSGSVNAVTSSQLDEAQRRGGHRVHLPIGRILAQGWDEREARDFVGSALAAGEGSPVILLDTLGTHLGREAIADGGTARRISDAAGLCAALASQLSDRTVMVVGGDALVGFVRDVGATLLEPLDELFPGVVVARYEGPVHAGVLVTKSGAFGSVGLFHEIHQALKEKVGGVLSCR